MNELMQVFATRPGTINQLMFERDRHRYEAFVQQNFQQNNNISSMDNEERRFETSIDIKVLGYLVGEGDNDKRPRFSIRKTLLRLKYLEKGLFLETFLSTVETASYAAKIHIHLIGLDILNNFVLSSCFLLFIKEKNVFIPREYIRRLRTMSAKNFKFVSPGVFIKEIDNSQRPRTAPPVGPVIIGRFRRGPAFVPTRVESLAELIQIFGEPVRGEESADVWRAGIPTGPTYGAYAAAAWLKNGSPVTIIRLLGDQHSTAVYGSASPDTTAGWRMGTSPANDSASGGACGLSLINSSSFAAGATGSVDGTLAATWYFNSGGINLSGTIAGINNTVVSGSGVLIESLEGASPAYSFTAQLYSAGGIQRRNC